MQIPDSKKLEILYDHYKDERQSLYGDILSRDKAFVLTFIFAAGLVAYGFLFPDPATTAEKMVSEKIGLAVRLNVEILNLAFWISFSSASLRYFQKAVQVEKNYLYLHKLEKDIFSFMSKAYIAKEGAFYSENYKYFSKTLGLFFKWVFPLAIVFATISKTVIGDYNDFGKTVLYSDIIFSLFILPIVIAYMFSHRKLKKHK